MGKIGVGQQTEKAVDNAMESMAKNIKFKRVVNFSITVLEEVCALSGTNNKVNCEFIAQRKGYKQCINVLQNHASSPEFCKKTCIILKQLLQNVDDPQLPYRMVESGCAEALQLIIETPPEKDDETKQYVLEILNSLFSVKGVLHKVVAKHGKGVLKMFMNTEQTKLAKNVIDCMRNTASEGLEELDNESLAKMNQLVMRHQQDLGVNVSGSVYIKNLFESSKTERVKDCGITVRDIVRSFGPHNMDEQVFRNLDVAIDKIGSEKEFYEVVDTITKNPNSDDFWIMSHLLDLPSVEISKKRSEINSILESADSNNLVKTLNSEVCFFLKELHRARPEMAKDLMKDKQSLIKKIMDEIDHIKGPHKFLGLQVLEQNIESHGKYMRENDIIKKAQKWVKECESPEDMVRILDFLSAFSGNSDFKQEMFSAGLDKLVIEKTKSNFAHNPKVFQALYKLMDNCVKDDADIQKFCESGNANDILALAGSLVDEIDDLGAFINFTNRLLNTKDSHIRFQGAFNDITRLYCTRFERRITDWFEKWFEERTKKEVWAASYKPKFLTCISTAEERQALRHVMGSYDLAAIEAVLHKAALGEKGMDMLTTLSQYISIFVCVIAKEEPDSVQQLTYRIAIDDAIQSLKNNLEFITEKAIKNRVISRYLAMFCALLPLFHQKSYLKRVTSKRLEFCCNEFINFIEYSVPKQPLVSFYLMSAYGLYEIPEAIKPEMPKIANAEGEEDKGAAVFHSALWTPLTFLLNDTACSGPITDHFLKLGKKKPDPLQAFAGYLSLREIYNFGTVDTDQLLDGQLLINLISQIDEETLDYETAASAIHCMDRWCEHSDKATLKLNSMGAYEKLVRFMNNLRNQDILKMIISSLLQKLANVNDGQQLEYDLERIVKKCKDYDEQCATKGDDLREDALGAYNELSGLIQMEKAQQYCNNKGLQSTTLNTLATELKRSPNDLLAKGLIVNYQDIILKLFETNTHLFRSAKAKPEELTLMSTIFKRTMEHWRNDTNTVRGLLELTLNVVRRKGQLEFNLDTSRRIYQELSDLAEYQRNNPDIVEKIAMVQALLVTEAPPEPEVPVPAPNSQTVEPVALHENAPHVDPPAPEPEPVPETPEEPEPTPAAPEPEIEAPVTEEQIQEMHAPPAAEEIEEEERNKQDLKETFVTEAIFATAQEQTEEAQPQPPEEDAPIVFAEPEHNQVQEEEPIIQEPPSMDWDLRVEEDRQKAMGMLATREANLEDNSQDGYIYQIVLKADELVTDELILAIFYAKWVTKVSSIQPIEYYVSNPFPKLKENIERFEGNPDLLKATCAATAARTKENPTQVANYNASDILVPLRNYCATSTDPATLVSFAKTISNTVADDEPSKIAASQKGVIRVFTNGIFKTLKDENETVHRSMFKAVKLLCSSKTSCPMNIEKTDFLEKLIDFAAESIPKPQIVVLVLEVLGVIFKFGGEKIRTLGIEFGVTNFYTEIFLTYKDDQEVMRYFYASAANIGDNQTFWKTLDSVELSGFIFGNLTTYPLEMTRSALVCLVFLTKIDDTCEKAVQTGLYRWLDPCIRAHNDTMVLSYIFVIENAITATMRRQNKLNEERFYDVVMQYHPEVVATKNEKLLILWLGVLCKLTNSSDSCASLLAYLYPTLDGLLREHYYNEPVFEKLYNLMSNILLGSHVPANEINALLHLSFHKLSVGTQTENFFMLYVNFLEKLSSMTDNAEISALLQDLGEQIIGSMHSVPLLLRHISEQIQAKFKLVFPRPVPPLAVTPWLKSSLDAKTLALCHAGTPCKRYRPQAVIETGMLFLDRQVKHLVFQKTNSLSIMSRDVMFLGDIIKLVKGHDERSYFAEAIQKHNLTIPQEVSLMVLSSKISYGETGFHVQFPDTDGRTLWKNAVRSFIDDVEAKK